MEESLLDRPLDSLPFSNRVYNCFYNQTTTDPNHPLKTLRDLVGWTVRDLLMLKNFGRRSVLETQAILDSLNLTLDSDGQGQATLLKNLEESVATLEIQKSYLAKRLAGIQNEINQHQHAIKGIKMART